MKTANIYMEAVKSIPAEITKQTELSFSVADKIQEVLSSKGWVKTVCPQDEEDRSRGFRMAVRATQLYLAHNRKNLRHFRCGYTKNS